MKSESFWRNFLTGLLVLAPAFLTVAILQLLFGWIYHLIIDPAARLAAFALSRDEASIMVHILIAIGFVLMITAIGFATRLLVLRRFFSFGETMVRRMPMVGPIYGTMREIADTFAGEKRGLFSRVVLLEWPGKGMYAVGFVTAEKEGGMAHVFVPHAPTPASGFLILAPRESLIPLDITVEEGMRLVISAGVSGPVLKLPEKKA